MRTEKRTSLRVPLSVNVVYWVNQQERKEAYQVESVNVGEGGIFVQTDLPLGIGTEVHLEFTLPGGGGPIRMTGKVAWSGGVTTTSERTVLGKGIEFMTCDDPGRKQLLDYIKAYGTE